MSKKSSDDPKTGDDRASLLDRLRARRRPRQARARRTRKAILEAARDAFNTHGYEGATIKDIGAQAGVSVGAIYEHFNDKRTILVEVGQMEVDRIKDESFSPLNRAVARRLTGKPVRAEHVIRMGIRGTFDSRRRYPRLLGTLTDMAARDEEFSAVVEQREEEAIVFVQDLIMLFADHPSERARVSARVLYRMLEGVVQHYALRGGSLNEDDIVEELTTMIMRYIFGRDPDIDFDP